MDNGEEATTTAAARGEDVKEEELCDSCEQERCERAR